MMGTAEKNYLKRVYQNLEIKGVVGKGIAIENIAFDHIIGFVEKILPGEFRRILE